MARIVLNCPQIVDLQDHKVCVLFLGHRCNHRHRLPIINRIKQRYLAFDSDYPENRRRLSFRDRVERTADDNYYAQVILDNYL